MITRAFVGRASVACAGVLLVLAAACTTRVSGSGRVVTKQIPVASFSRIQVGGAFDVTLTTGQQDRVTLRLDDNLVDRVDVGISNDILHVRLKSGTSVQGATLHADVMAVRVTGIEASGASKVHLADGFGADAINVSLSGASRIDGRLGCTEVRMQLSGASNATVAGSAQRLEVEASGASRVDARDLEGLDVMAKVSGASQATVWPRTTLSAEASGASSIRYRGSPQLTHRDASGASSIEPL